MFDTAWSIKYNKNYMLNLADCSTKEEAWFNLLLDRMDITDKETFLNPTFSSFHDPFLLPNIDSAIDRILEAVDNGEHIVIFGDYDADGVTATTILYDFLSKQMEADCEYMLPSRFGDGYGLSKGNLDEIAKNGATLIITVDNGVSAVEEIAYAKELGIDVVVTDHHEIPAVLPDCIAIVNPHLEESEYPCKVLCGAGVAYKLVQAISVSVGLDDDYIKYLPLAAVGTIGDIVPLVDENRTIAKLGLQMLKETEFAGLRALLKDSRLANLNSESVSFYLVPLINVPGRMATADLAVELLLASSDHEAEELLANILTLVDDRNKASEKIIKACEDGAIITEDKSLLLIAKGDDFNHGVVGNVAGKLSEKYNKTAIVMAFDKREDGENYYRASARAKNNLNLYEMLTYCSQHGKISKFGGHEKAAGFTIAESEIPEFIKNAEEFIKINNISNVNKKQAMFYLPEYMLTVKFVDELSKLEPFGEGNPKPIFFTDGIAFTSTRILKDAHLKCVFSFPDGKNYEAMAFGNSQYEPFFYPNIRGGVFYNLTINTFNGRTSVQMALLDFAEYYGDDDFEKAYTLSRDGAAYIYGQISKLGQQFTFSDVINIKNNICKDETVPISIKNEFSWFKIKSVLSIFVELGYINMIKKDCYEFVKDCKKTPLTDSILFRELA